METTLVKLIMVTAIVVGVCGGFMLAAPEMSNLEQASACLPDGSNCGLGWIASNATTKVLAAANQFGAADSTTAGLNAGPVANPYKAEVKVERGYIGRHGTTQVTRLPESPPPPVCHYEPVAATRTTRRPVQNSDGTLGVEITHITVYVSIRICR